MTMREIVQIDEEKCDGCGHCVPACEEGAIQIIEGKARVVSDVYCDGLGACLGHCPQGAISIVRREAVDFDQQAVTRHLRAESAACGGSTCPGTAVTSLTSAAGPAHPVGDPSEARLGNWPVQLHLVPPGAPFLRHADLLLVADCVPLACANFHSQVLRGRPVVIGCPKLDDCQRYLEKLIAILRHAQLRSLTVAHMEVPCCTGLLSVADMAVRQAGVSVPLSSIMVTRNGSVSDPELQNVALRPTGKQPRDSMQLPILSEIT